MIGLILFTAFVAEPLPIQDAGVAQQQGEALKIDILVKQPEQNCEQQSGDEIVVCAKKADNESQRLRPIPKTNIYGKDESKAEFGISENVRMAAEVDSEELQQGIIAKRIMARVRIKF